MADPNPQSAEQGFDLARPRRSALYVPGSNARAMEKARSLPVDVLILDLEDAVAPEAKDRAREAVAVALAEGHYPDCEVLVRINGFETPWIAEDLASIVPHAPSGVVFSKISTPHDVHRAEDALAQSYAGPGTRLWVMIETARAVLESSAIAACAERSGAHLSGFIVGTNDLAREIGITVTASRLAMLFALQQTILSAKAFRLACLDGVNTRLDDPAAFVDECRQGRGLGFDGKTLIHPGQIEPANAAFAPSVAEIDAAVAIVNAFSHPESMGKGVLVVDGRMVEMLHYEQALMTLRKAEAIAAKMTQEPSIAAEI